MKILVGVKHVPHTETKIQVGGDGKSIDESGVKWVLSPYDEYAVEEALKIKEARGEGEVVLVHLGTDAAQSSIRQGLAMGADRAILIDASELAQADGTLRAKILAAVVRKEEAELFLCGKYGVGTDEGQTGPMTAEALGWGHVSTVTKLHLDGDAFRAEREIEGAVEIHEGKLPAVISCEKGLNDPRLASLRGIMQAKKKPVDKLTLAELGVAAEDPQKVVWEALELPPARKDGRLIEGSPEEAAQELARLLREEAKVI